MCDLGPIYGLRESLQVKLEAKKTDDPLTQASDLKDEVEVSFAIVETVYKVRDKNKRTKANKGCSDVLTYVEAWVTNHVCTCL